MWLNTRLLLNKITVSSNAYRNYSDPALCITLLHAICNVCIRSIFFFINLSRIANNYRMIWYIKINICIRSNQDIITNHNIATYYCI